MEAPAWKRITVSLASLGGLAVASLVASNVAAGRRDPAPAAAKSPIVRDVERHLEALIGESDRPTIYLAP